MSKDAVLEQAALNDLRLVRFLYCDYGSIIRGKATNTKQLASRMDEGIGLVRGMMVMNSLDQLQSAPDMTAVGEVRIVPDPESFAVLPYAPGVGSMMSDFKTLDREPWEACPRTFLRRVLDGAAARKIRIEAAIENEFFLVREVDGRMVPADQSLCFSSAGMDSAAAFTDDLLAALAGQGIQLEQAMPEYGAGQQEISTTHGPALRTADNQPRVRDTARAIAARHGLIASFAPKPFPDQIGSGAHIHLSLWDTDTGANLLFDPRARYGLSKTGLQFVAGVLDHLPALTALTCPSVNSYRRLQPQAWASAFVCYGFDNREAAVRVPSNYWGREQGTTNVELKTVDNICNPYLAIGGMIVAGLDGVARQLDPGPALDVDPGLLSDAERERRGYRRLPGSLTEALDNLHADKVLTSAMGESMSRGYDIVRRSEVAAYADKGDDFEFAQHLAKY